ncbi:hypothetical protein [Nocardioides acrostichi]|uniref:Uncharacterized protein n=1 Tax=Nocardioides acrostichi TaxID=2784339 RepID=A0A930YDL6_9ACTN|nr:hypothetical protein [Nocardioides acrostichi]MBF4162594.1 hypothetical protein [Nocardioides acrostichi]
MTAKKFSTILAAAEKAAEPTILATQEAHAAALERQRNADPDLEAAEDRLADIEGSWRRGEDEYNTTQHSEAVSAVKRAELRKAGAKRAIGDAQRRLLSTDVRLASALTGALGIVLPGVTIVPTFVVPKDAAKASDLPVCLIVQSKETELRKNGTVAGHVEVVYFRDNIHRPLDAREVERACDRLGLHVDAQGFVSSTENRDTLRLVVNSAHESDPVLAKVGRPEVLTGKVAHALADAVRYGTSTVAHRGDDNLWASSHLEVLPMDSTIVAEEVTEDGRRTLTVRGTLGVRLLKNCDPLAALDGVLTELDRGRFVSGLGMLTSVRLLPAGEVETEASKVAQQIARAGGERLDASRLGFEALDHNAYTFEAVLSSRTDPANVTTGKAA